MKFQFIFSVTFFVLFSHGSFGQYSYKKKYDEKNKIGIELLKPLSLMPFSSTTVEGVYTRRLNKFAFYRGTVGYAYFQRGPIKRNVYFHSEGFYTKQGIDLLPGGELSHYDLLIGISPFVIAYEEKGRGKFKGDYFDDTYSPYMGSDYLIGGLETAVRLLFNFPFKMSLELSFRMSMPFLGEPSTFDHYYMPGIGYGIIRRSNGTPLLGTGAEVKIFYRFN